MLPTSFKILSYAPVHKSRSLKTLFETWKLQRALTSTQTLGFTRMFDAIIMLFHPTPTPNSYLSFCNLRFNKLI